MSAPRAVIEFHESEDDELSIKLLFDGVEKHIPYGELSSAQEFAVLMMRVIAKAATENSKE